MAELRSIPCRKTEDEPCPWCHKSYPCFDLGHSSMSCPRVAAYSFLPWEDIHEDGWYIGGVQFRDEITLEAEVDGD